MSEELEGQMALFGILKVTHTETQGLSTRYSRTFDVYVPWQEADQTWLCQLCNMTHLVADIHS